MTSRLNRIAYRAVADRAQRNEIIERAPIAQCRAESGREQPDLAMKSHVVEQHRLHQQVHAVRCRATRRLDIAIPTEVSDLTRAVHQFGWARWIVDEEERRSCLLIVAGPYAFPASVDGIVDRAVGRQGPVAEDVQHQRLALACSVFQACTHALASTEVSYLAGCTLARVVVEAAHADRTCARIA